MILRGLAVFVVLVLAGCAPRSTGRDTSGLARNVSNAQTGVEQARRSTDAVGGNVGRARTAAELVDAKTIVVLKWLKEQQERERRP